jgi:hypothetical protein
VAHGLQCLICDKQSEMCQSLTELLVNPSHAKAMVPTFCE